MRDQFPASDPFLVELLCPSAHCNIPQQLLNEVDVGQHHAATAVAAQTELVHGISVRSGVAVLLDRSNKLDVALVQVGDDLAAGEAADGDNHGDGVVWFGCAGGSRGMVKWKSEKTRAVERTSARL